MSTNFCSSQAPWLSCRKIRDTLTYAAGVKREGKKLWQWLDAAGKTTADGTSKSNCPGNYSKRCDAMVLKLPEGGPGNPHWTSEKTSYFRWVREELVKNIPFTDLQLMLISFFLISYENVIDTLHSTEIIFWTLLYSFTTFCF